MQTTVRWLHLSDFHVGMDNYGQRKLFEQICGHVKETVASGAIPDLVFLTGDLANRGANTEYAEFFELMLAPLLDALGGPLWAGKIFCCSRKSRRRENTAVVFRARRDLGIAWAGFRSY